MKAAIQQRVLRALQRLGDVRETVIYSHVTTGTYDPDSGTVSTSVVSVQCPAVFTEYTAHEMSLAQGQIHKEDRRVLLVPSELTFVPQVNDTLERNNGEVWKVVREGFSMDPADALYLVQVRKYTDGAS